MLWNGSRGLPNRINKAGYFLIGCIVDRLQNGTSGPVTNKEIEVAMATLFGIEESDAQGFIEKGMVCLPRLSDDKLNLHSTVSPIKNEDIVFIKHFTPQSSLHIKAIGVVHSDFPTESDVDRCLPVEWVWRGEKVIEHFDEKTSMDGRSLYEEHDILVQREIIDLLPRKYQLQPEW